MKSKTLKKVLATVLTLSLVMAPAMGVYASTTNNEPSKNSSSSSSSSVTSTEAVSIPSTSNVTLGGKVLKTTTRGAYMSVKLPGTVVLTDRAALAAGYGLTAGEQPYVRIYDISEKSSPAAMTSINAAAGAFGGTVVASINVELGKMSGGKFSLLAQTGTPVTMAFGIPKASVKPGYAYAMICVRPGGAIEILPDLDADPNTVTFNTAGGLGAYAMIMYPAV